MQRDEQGFPEATNEEWANAIAVQVCWGLREMLDGDKETEAAVYDSVVAGLKDRPDLVDRLVGTQVIPESFFEVLHDDFDEDEQ